MNIKIDKHLAEFIARMCRNNGISYKAYANSLLEKAITEEIIISHGHEKRLRRSQLEKAIKVDKERLNIPTRYW
jgi:hypothetical protein